MAGDLIRETRRAVLAALKANAGVTVLVPATRIYPQTQPANSAWPFIRWDGPSSLPIEAACVAGATVTFYLHAFAKPRKSGEAVLETAEDHASRILSAAILALRNKRLPVDGGLSALMRYRSAQLMIDTAEADAFHALATFDARILAA